MTTITHEALADLIAQQWDGCMYDSVGETIDIGQAIRAAGKRLTALPELLAAQPPKECTTCESGVFATDGTGPYDCYACGKAAAIPPQQEPLWCLHILGPDEIYPAPSKAHAEKAAEAHNALFKERSERLGIKCEAVVVPYPYDAAGHAAGVADFISEWLLPRWQVEALETRAAAPVAAEAAPRNVHACIDLTACQLHEALLMAGDPEFDAEFEDRSRVRIFYAEKGHGGAGLYCECVDAEEEGCILLDGTSPAIREAAPQAVDLEPDTFCLIDCPGWPGGLEMGSMAAALDYVRRFGSDNTRVSTWKHQAGRRDYSADEVRSMIDSQQKESSDG